MGKLGYWEKRYLQDKCNSINRSERYIRTQQKKLYQQANRELQDAIRRMYESVAEDEKITLAEARRRISQTDFKKIDFQAMSKQAVRLGREIRSGKLPEQIRSGRMKRQEAYEAQLRMFTRKGQITQLELKQLEIEKILLDLYDKNQVNIYELLAGQYEDSYYRQIFNTQQRIGFGKDFVRVNEEAVNRAILNTYKKSNYSARLWKHRDKLGRELRENLMIGLIRGEGVDKLAKRISRRMDVAQSAAERLVRTETAYIYETAARKAYQECGVEKYQYLATLDKRTSQICQELDGQIFFLKDARVGVNYPPMHPNCRSTTVCAFDDDKVTERLAKDQGKYYKVPSDMTYKEWRKQHLPPEAALTYKEKAALTDYMSFRAYLLNEKLRSGTMTPEDRQFEKRLNRALDKMPNYEGNLLRDLQFTSKEQRADFLRQIAVNQEIHFPEFISTTTNNSYNDDFDVRIYIQNAKNGKDIRTFNSAENEVLYKSNSTFVSRTVVEMDGKVFILMEEANG